MSVLPDLEIEAGCHVGPLSGLALISPYDRAQLAPSSYDVRLAALLKVPQPSGTAIDLRKPVEQSVHEFVMGDDAPYVLRPNGFVLGSTVEWVNIPEHLVCRIEGRSSFARPGLQVHSAGFIDPGYQGNITLEITNFGPDPILLHKDLLVAQLCFEELSSPCRQPYRGKYQGSKGVVTSRHNQDLTESRSAA